MRLEPMLVFCRCGRHGRITWPNGATGPEMIAKDSALEILHNARLGSPKEREFAEMIGASKLPAEVQDLESALIERYLEFILLRIKCEGISPIDPHKFLFSDEARSDPVIVPSPKSARPN